MSDMKQACSSSDVLLLQINDEWRQQETHRATFAEHVICVRRVDGAAAAEGIGGVLHIKAASPPLGVISERWILIGRKGVAFALYGYEQNKMIFFFLSVRFIVHSVSENTRRKCMCVWHKGGSKDKISELMIKREAAIRTVTLLLLKKKRNTYWSERCLQEKKKKHLVIQLIRCAQ